MMETELRNLMFVPRWTIIRVIRQQNVAEHSYFVALYALRLAQALNQRYGQQADIAKTVQLALLHDVQEIVKSDIPGPVSKLMCGGPPENKKRVKDWVKVQFHKIAPWYFPMMADLEDTTKIEQSVVKVADYLESILYLYQEKGMGNATVEGHIDYIRELLDDAIDAGFSGRLRTMVIDFCNIAIDTESNNETYVVR